MAETRTEKGLQRSEPGRGLSAWDPFGFGRSGPFSMFRRMQEEMDRIFESFGRSLPLSWSGERADWIPAIEAFQRGNEFVVRAEVPGLTKDDVTAEITEDALTIRGERKYDHEEEREGMYRSERSYGSFYRVIPLPEGALPESAKASFQNGVLEVVIQAPSREARRGRQIEITEGSSKEQRK